MGNWWKQSWNKSKTKNLQRRLRERAVAKSREWKEQEQKWDRAQRLSRYDVWNSNSLGKIQTEKKLNRIVQEMNYISDIYEQNKNFPERCALDSTGTPIGIGDVVLFRGREYQIARFIPRKGPHGNSRIEFSGPQHQHPKESADESSVVLVTKKSDREETFILGTNPRWSTWKG
jgi:hypothetical protein